MTIPFIPRFGVADARAADGKIAPPSPGDGALFNDALTSALGGAIVPDASAPQQPMLPADTELQRVLVTLAARLANRQTSGHAAEQTGGALGGEDDAIALPCESIHSGETVKVPRDDVATGDEQLTPESSPPLANELVDADTTIAAATTEDGLEARPVLTPAAGLQAELAAGFVAALPGMLGIGEVASAGETQPTVWPGTGVGKPMFDTLIPEFRSRLERVIDRMQTEFGYKVEVVETVRSQERQDQLFRQGRVTPGAVVTWTRSSRHTDGLAADLKVDGTWSNPVAYDRLARVAGEEGLRTLGTRDPGHVELSRAALAKASAAALDDDGAATATRIARLMEGIQSASRQATRVAGGLEPVGATVPDTPPQVDGIARVAQVARTATVAQVARVATVAQVAGLAKPGTSREAPAEAPSFTATVPDAARTTPRSIVEARQATPVSHLPAGVAPEAGPPNDARHDHVSTKERERDLRRVEPGVARGDESVLARALEVEPRESILTTNRVERAEPRLSTTVMDRINQIVTMRDTAADRPLSSVLLRLDRPDGGADRIRVDLRGSAVGASFDMSDAGMAEDLGRHLTDLARSLGRQGLDAEAVTVRALAGKEPSLGVAQAVAAERDALRATMSSSLGGGQGAGRENRGAPSRQDHPHDEPTRQRPRRESRGDQ